MKHIIAIPGVFCGEEQYSPMSHGFRRAGFTQWFPCYWRDTEPLGRDFVEHAINHHVEGVAFLIERELPHQEEIYFLVQSMGTIILSRLLKRLAPQHRERVKKAVIASPTVKLSDAAMGILGKPAYQDMLATNKPFRLLTDREENGGICNDIAYLFFNGVIHSWIEQMKLRFTTRTIVTELAVPQEISLDGVPGLVIIPGEGEDACHEHADQVRLANQLGAELSVLNKTSHVGILEHPEFAPRVVEFFNR